MASQLCKAGLHGGRSVRARVNSLSTPHPPTQCCVAGSFMNGGFTTGGRLVMRICCSDSGLSLVVSGTRLPQSRFERIAFVA